MNKTLILLYHHCNSYTYIKNRPDKKLYVTDKMFERQIKWLNEKFNIVSLSDGILKQKNKKIDNVVITFDDGHYDNYKYAYPILKLNNIPAIIFLTTSWINKSNYQWRSDIVDLLLSSKEIYIINKYKEWQKLKINKLNINIIYKQISEMFVLSNQSKRRLLLKQILDKNLKTIKDRKKDFLNWDIIQKLFSEGIVNFGAHSHSHTFLSDLSLSKAKLDIMKSKSIIETKINTNIVHFAYPYGKENAAYTREYKIIKNLKFKTGCTSIPGNLNFKKKNYNPYALPRLSIDGRWNFNTFKLQIENHLV